MTRKPVTHHLRPAKSFAQEYKLTLADGIPPAINSRYLFVYKAPNSTGYQKDLTDRLSRALASFLCQPQAGVLALPQLAGKIYLDKQTGRLSLKVAKDSSVKFVVSQRNDITYQSLKPDEGFPMRLLPGKIFAAGFENIPGPDRSGGLEAFSAQLTFISGGFVLCVNKHHFLLDANSTGKLIHWGLKRARSYMPGMEAEDVKFADPSTTLAMHDNSSLWLETSVPTETHDDWKVIPNAKPHVFGLELPPASVMFIGKMLPSLKPKIENAVFPFLGRLAVRATHKRIGTFQRNVLETRCRECFALEMCFSRPSVRRRFCRTTGTIDACIGGQRSAETRAEIGPRIFRKCRILCSHHCTDPNPHIHWRQVTGRCSTCYSRIDRRKHHQLAYALPPTTDCLTEEGDRCRQCLPSLYG